LDHAWARRCHVTANIDATVQGGDDASRIRIPCCWVSGSCVPHAGDESVNVFSIAPEELQSIAHGLCRRRPANTGHSDETLDAFVHLPLTAPHCAVVNSIMTVAG
jgi:hypothetical protein